MNHKQINILVAEDSSDDIVLIRRAFAKAKLVNRLDIVQDGEEALAFLKRQGKYKDGERPGLLLLDINMPKKNGFEVLEEIKKDPILKDLPVIILTTSREEEDVAHSYASGACSFISKPINFSEFETLAERFELYWTLVARVPDPTGK